MLLLYYYALWGIHGVFGEYSRGIHMYRVCVGYVSGMYREFVETYWMRVGFLFKFRARKINFQQQKQQKINNIPLANIASGKKYKITIEILWQAHVGLEQGSDVLARNMNKGQITINQPYKEVNN